MTVQCPPFRRSVALQMDGYRERMAEAIRNARASSGLGPGELADRVGVSHKTVERWENGKASPQHANLRSLAKTLGVEVDDLRPDLPPDQDTLERIEAKLDRLLLHAGLPVNFDAISLELEEEFKNDPPGGPNGSST
jgi:transcriptional regulator with XRE-family HTH domain